jgi:hypothetical protein
MPHLAKGCNILAVGWDMRKQENAIKSEQEEGNNQSRTARYSR